MDEEVVIKVDKVYKDFILPHERNGSVKGIFTSMFSKATKIKEKQHALKDISFEVKKGEFFGIVGRNGSGKSTLLKILANIYQPSKGSASTSGKLVPFIELGVGFNPELTGRDNVYLNGAILGFSKKEIAALYDSIVEFAELERFMDQKLKNYSSGMQVRLAFSMAIRANADILLIDEVLAVGDADFQRKCFNYFKKLKNDKKTVVFVSHDMSAVREYCDRAVLINDSNIISVGTANAVSQKYSQLFMKNEQVEEEGSGQNRWGDATAKIIDITVKVDDTQISISQKIKANADIDSPMLGFRIRDRAGNEVTGTNTRLEKRKIPSLTKGQNIVLKWTIPNVFSDGEYYFDPAILHEDGVGVIDWWDEAAMIRIKKSRHLPYNMDPGFELVIDDQANE
jgi:ABC-2 type transport system ATP-binding protein